MERTVHVAPTAGSAGLGGWWRSYRLLVWWELLSLRLNFAIITVVQVCVGAGSAVGFGFLFDEVPPEQAIYLSTGASVVALLMVGMAMTPQAVSQNRADGTWDFLWALPVERSALLASAVTIWSLVALPGMAVALGAAVLRYDIAVSFDAMIVPAVLLTLAMSISIGYAVAIVSGSPRVAGLVSQILFVGLLMFAPINFPAARFPDWLAELHRYLPFEPAADLVRTSISDAGTGDPGRSLAVLALWTIVAVAASMVAIRRRS